MKTTNQKQNNMKTNNHIQLTGRLGANPQIKLLNTGSKVARFSMAVVTTYTTKKGEKVSDVQWHSIIAWGTLANNAERLLFKGNTVTIEGQLVSRAYTNKQGIKRSVTEIVAKDFILQQKEAA